ncbi:MAG TPA: shikimate dehydrogenase [Chthoniobacterales bacterium]|jgi:shikimate dehydrogenase
MKKKPPHEVYTLADLQNWSEATKNVQPPIRLAVIGEPVAHSLSPQMQNAALHESGIKMQYARIQLGETALTDALKLFRQNEFIGLNVTLPHKERVLSLMDEIDENAKEAGVINTIAIRDQKLIGFNTDGIGFSHAIRDEFSVDLRDLRVLVLGAGGAARAIAFECARQGCERLVIANRTRAKAEGLVQTFQSFFTGPRVLGPVARLQAIGLSDPELRSQIAHTDLLVNATPLGLQRSDRSAVAEHLLAPHLMVFDTTYSAGRSLLLVAAEKMGARGSNGVSMLVHQGARAFEIWFGREAPVEVMRRAVVDALTSSR